MNLRKILLLENVPYLLSLLFIGIGWSISFMVNKIDKLTLVEYQCIREGSSQSETFRYRFVFSNITSDRLIDSVNFYFDYDNSKGKAILEATTYGIPPATSEGLGKDLTNPLLYTVPVTYFQPGSSIEVPMIVSGDFPPVFTYTSKQGITFVEKTWITFLYRNYLLVFLCMIGIWVVLIIVYLYYYSKDKPIRKNYKRHV